MLAALVAGVLVGMGRDAVVGALGDAAAATLPQRVAAPIAGLTVAGAPGLPSRFRFRGCDRGMVRRAGQRTRHWFLPRRWIDHEMPRPSGARPTHARTHACNALTHAFTRATCSQGGLAKVRRRRFKCCRHTTGCACWTSCAATSGGLWPLAHLAAMHRVHAACDASTAPRASLVDARTLKSLASLAVQCVTTPLRSLGARAPPGPVSSELTAHIQGLGGVNGTRRNARAQSQRGAHCR